MAVHPTSVNNSFLRHLVFWGLFLPLLSILLVPLFAPDQKIHGEEITMVSEMGVDVTSLNSHSRQTFTRFFVDTKLVSSTEKFFSGRVEGKPDSPRTAFSRKWINGVWQMVYRAVWRLRALSLIFFIPVICLALPAFIDGLSVRARKKYDFEADDPGIFYSSAHLATVALGLFVCLPFLPFALTANLLALMLVALVGAVWVASSNFQ